MERNNELQATINELLYDDDVYEVLNHEPDREKEEQIRNAYLRWKEKPAEVIQDENWYVSRMYEKFDYLLKGFKHSRHKVMIDDWNSKLMKFVDDLSNERKHFTSKQWEVIDRKISEWEAAAVSKDKYLSMKSGDYVPSDDEHCEESSIISDEDMFKDGGCVAPQNDDK